MSVVTIPFDFETGRHRRSLVPICISQTDADGRRIASGWFEAVVPIAEYLRKLARERMRDVWRVSELAELSVHAQWRNHGENLGRYPHRQIAEYARWAAEDLRCGHVRLRKGLDILLGDGDKSLVDPLDYQSRFDSAHDLDQLRKSLQRVASDDAVRILELIVRGFSWEEIARSLGKDATERTLATLRRRHSRVIRRVLAIWGASAPGTSALASAETYDVAPAWLRARGRG